MKLARWQRCRLRCIVQHQLLVLLVLQSPCIMPVMSSGNPAQGGNRAPFHTSSRHSKATLCRFMGAVPFPQKTTEEVVFNVFIRAIAVGNKRLLVRAFSFMQPTRAFRPGNGQLQEAQAIVEKYYPLTGSLHLKSLTSARSMPLRRFDPVMMEEPTVWVAELPLDPEDDDMGELSLRAEGFTYKCLVVLERMDDNHPGLDIATSCNSSCIPQPLNSSSSIRQSAPPMPPVGTNIWRGSKGAVWVFTPMMFMSARNIAVVLQYHWEWHKLMGVTKYVLYVLSRVSELTRIPQIKAMVAAGHLEIILWDSLPAHSTGLRHKDGYAHQYLILNAAILEHWTQDVHLVMLDLDEWIMTPRPMSVSQIFDACTPGGYVAGFSPLIKPLRCRSCSENGTVAELAHWNDLLGGGPAQELAIGHAHTNAARSEVPGAGVNFSYSTGDSLQPDPNMYPLTLYELAGSINYSHWMPRKAIVNPNYILSAALHEHRAMPCAHYHAHYVNKCNVHFGHMIKLFAPRTSMYGYNVEDYFKSVVRSVKWWWPALPRLPVWVQQLPQ